MDRLLELQMWVNNCASESLQQKAKWPTCSRCLKPLVCRDVGPMPGAPLSRKYEWRCPDRCASVTERWYRAASRIACGWFKALQTCSRCGHHLLKYIGRDDTHYWCACCGPTDGWPPRGGKL